MTESLFQVMFMSSMVVHWKSMKLSVTVDSTIEAKYVTAFEAARGVWGNNFVCELGVIPTGVFHFLR